MSDQNPHFVAYCRCLREIVARKGWDAVDDPEVDMIYDQMDFHWDHLGDDERESVWGYSQQLQDQENDDMSQQVHKGRWGFYPCDYETYRKIKELHKWYYQAVRDWANWCRWERKDPKNRVIRKYHRDKDGNKVGYEIVGPRPEPPVCPHFYDGKLRSWCGPDEFGIVAAYRNARYPKPTEKDVVPFSESKLDFLMKLHAQVASWYEDQRKAA